MIPGQGTRSHMLQLRPSTAKKKKKKSLNTWQNIFHTWNKKGHWVDKLEFLEIKTMELEIKNSKEWLKGIFEEILWVKQRGEK